MVLFGDNLELLPLGDRLLGPGEAGPDPVLVDAMDLEHRNHGRGAAGEHERRDQKDGEALHHGRNSAPKVARTSILRRYVSAHDLPGREYLPHHRAVTLERLVPGRIAVELAILKAAEDHGFKQLRRPVAEPMRGWTRKFLGRAGSSQSSHRTFRFNPWAAAIKAWKKQPLC